MSAQAFIAVEQDFTILHGDDINCRRWTFTVGTPPVAYDFSNATDAYLRIYSEAGGTLLLERLRNPKNGVTVKEWQGAVSDIPDGVVEWNDAWIRINLDRDLYYYELYYKDSTVTHPNIKIAYGVLTVK